MNKLAKSQYLEGILKKKISNEDIERFLWGGDGDDDEDYFDDDEIETVGGRGGEKSKFLLHPRNFDSDSEEIEDQEKSPIKSFSKGRVSLKRSQQKKEKLSLKPPPPPPPPAPILKNTNKQQQPPPPKEPVGIGDTGRELKAIIKNNKKNDSTTKPPMKTATKLNKSLAESDADKRIACLNYEKKFPQLAAKTLKLLNEIKKTLDHGIQPPDGDEDEQRRTKRLQEFALRFSRNYIYPLLRQMDEVLALDKDSANLTQKILIAYSPINLGLQAYVNFLPNSIGKCAIDKLKTVIDQLLHLIEIQEQQKWDQGIIKLLRENIESLLETVANFNKRTDGKMAVGKKTPKKKKVSVPTSSTKLQARISTNLSVYSASSGFRKDEQFKKAVDFLSKKKYNVKSRYLTSLFKHRPPNESKCNVVVMQPPKAKLFGKRSSTILRNTPINSPVNEDTIETMIGIGEEELEIQQQMENRADERGVHVRDLDNGGNSGYSHHPYHHRHHRHRHEVNNDGPFEAAAGNAGDIAKSFNILRQCLSDKNMREVIMKLMEDYKQQDKQQPQQQQQLDKQDGDEQGEDNPTSKKNSVVAITGTKNAKLICIRDERDIESLDDGDDISISIDETPKQQTTENNEKARMTEKDEGPQNTIEVGTKCNNSNNSRRQLKLLKRIDTVKKRPLQLLSNAKTVSIIQYNLNYHKFTQKNPMYRRSSNLQPTTLVAKMADEILYELLQEIVDEIEVDSMLENLYNSEFQYDEE